MKSMLTSLINKPTIVFLIVLFNLLILGAYIYYQPLCEPCINKDCPPCRSDEQIGIIYMSLFINLGFVFFLIRRILKLRRLTQE